MKAYPKLYEVLKRASLFLEEYNREPKMAELLLQYTLGVDQTTMLTMLREPVAHDTFNRFWDLVNQHAETGIPLEHITGVASFYGRDFHVNSDTLIPRPETEELIELAKKTAPRMPLRIADIGTGSGCIAVTLALEIPNAAVYATDISSSALDIAEKNARKLGADVTFFQGDYGEPLIEQGIRADIVISNPPYIADSAQQTLADTVRDFEPSDALFAGSDGLTGYKTIIRQLPDIVHRHGYALMEIGYDQGEPVRSLVKSVYPSSEAHIMKDINGKDRMLKAGPLIDL